MSISWTSWTFKFGHFLLIAHAFCVTKLVTQSEMGEVCNAIQNGRSFDGSTDIGLSFVQLCDTKDTYRVAMHDI